MHKPPTTGFIETLHPLREGRTEITINGHDYTFEPNAQGRCVCDVQDARDYQQILSVGSGYTPFESPMLTAANAAVAAAITTSQEPALASAQASANALAKSFAKP